MPGLITASSTPVAYASVQRVRDSLRAALSFDEMRNLLFPVTASARQQAASEGANFPGFAMIASSAIATSDGVRGINEVYELDGVEGPVVDGRPYADPEFTAELEAYHLRAVSAHSVDRSLPLPIPVPGRRAGLPVPNTTELHSDPSPDPGR